MKSGAVKSVNARLAEELAVGEGQVAAAVRLLDEGSTVPFIARYRKEVTGSLDDGQLRSLEERLGYLRELDDRRAAVLASIKEQGKLTDELTAALMSADTKARVEDIYLPYKPKRRTKAQIAREAGLEPLADTLLADPALVPDDAAAAFVGENVPDVAAALDGARHIVVERAAEDAELVGALRERFWEKGSMRARPSSDAVATSPAAQKFRDYFDFTESLATMPVAPGAGRAARREGAGAGAEPGRRRGRSLSGDDRRGARHRSVRLRCGHPVARRHRRLRLADQVVDLRLGGRPRPAASCAPRRTPWRCSPRTSRICCWPPRRATAPPWASTPVSGPA